MYINMLNLYYIHLGFELTAKYLIFLRDINESIDSNVSPPHMMKILYNINTFKSVLLYATAVICSTSPKIDIIIVAPAFVNKFRITLQFTFLT